MDRMTLFKRGSESSRDYAYHIIKHNILNLSLEPGMSISETDMSDKLELSRTPVREAFIQLSEEGLIDIYPQKGSFVSLIDLEQVKEARFLREVLEVAVVEAACGSFTEEDLFEMEALIEHQKQYNDKKEYAKLHELDEQFHHLLFSKCGKQRTWAFIQQNHAHYKRIRLLLLTVYFDWEAIIRQHTRIMGFIREADHQSAKEEMKEHLRYLIIENDELIQQHSDFFRYPKSTGEIWF
ncbi:GntR family transcriptional regulator [Paenibacillus sp. J2TS4]|uniref:GntR family transcriptional regulator n=1 Tax=Paenibacillus sp. J2TS4 TaxID=2807194 RepID=UPI001B29F221|nr:GntR family transcriptional regulator [Paenibacillus sp. J2TS4]GIP34840.1 GntR family transcriptional regulator [Paenibacillus sp. J2TS4]